MSIATLLSAKSIRIETEGRTREDIYKSLISMHKDDNHIDDIDAFGKDIDAREALSNTAIGEGICIPHAKSDAVKNAGLALVISKKGVNCDALDGAKCDLFFMIAAPKDSDFHLDTLSTLMRLLVNPEFKDKLRSCTTAEEALETISKAESAKEASVASSDTVNNSVSKDNASNDGKDTPKKLILAVTACPTGIAHTYMAAEALENKGKELGVDIKVETNGSGGVKNLLTDDEIARADAIIIAADTNVAMSRFDNKPLIRVKVSDGIRKAESLIKQCIDGDISVYKHKGDSDSKSNEGKSKESIGRQLYKHLMSGVSHMLPFVISGGICIALAFLIDGLAGNGDVGGDFGSTNAVASWFMTLGGAAFGFMLPVLAGYIAYSIADRPGLVVGFVGGAIASSGFTFLSDASEWVSGGFLGALLAGFLAGYSMLLLKKCCDKYLPKALDGLKPILIYPLLGVIIIGLIMSLINPIMGIINTALQNGLTSLGDNASVGLGILLGAMMAIDMGGPINKAAYVFGIAAIESGNYEIMAAVMIGGMVPPIAIALATTFFKSKFTINERKAGPVNYIMGLCFITEGAIPYAAADPARVIPSVAVGSAIAGGLSMLFHATLRAPHGGIFVIAVIGNWYWYLLSLVIGSVVGMIMLALLKKKVQVPVVDKQ